MAIIDQVTQCEAWVIDGNYRSVSDLIRIRATHIIWLNYSFSLVFYRAVRRTLRRVITKETLFSGNRENFRQVFFDKESIIWWVIKTYKRRKTDYRKLFDEKIYPHLVYIELKNQNEANTFLALF